MTIRGQLARAKHLIKSDLYRYSGKISLKVFAETYIREPGFNFMVWLRIRTVFKSKIVGYILHTKRIRFGIDIQSLKIGEGFYIGHFGHIVVNGDAIIGKNCNISQGVTIGIANTGSKKGIPVVGDYVYIGPGAKILGNIKIGNNAAIGANSVVVSDVPENAVVVGVPARVVSYDGSVGYINRIFENSIV